MAAKWNLVEKTMYGRRKAEIYQNKNTKRFKIEFFVSGNPGKCIGYYKNIPQFITGRSI